MSEGSKIHQPRPPGTTQRDAAFSDIFGSAPPPGRSQTMNSPVQPPVPSPSPPSQQFEGLRHHASGSNLREQYHHSPPPMPNNNNPTAPQFRQPMDRSSPPPLANGGYGNNNNNNNLGRGARAVPSGLQPVPGPQRTPPPPQQFQPQPVSAHLPGHHPTQSPAAANAPFAYPIPQPPPSMYQNQSPPLPSPNRNRAGSPRSLAEWTPPPNHSNVPRLKTPQPPMSPPPGQQQQMPPPPPPPQQYRPSPSSSSSPSQMSFGPVPVPPQQRPLQRPPSNPNLRQQGPPQMQPQVQPPVPPHPTQRTASNPHLRPGFRKTDPSPRSMSMTNSTPQLRPQMSTPSSASYDREHRSHTMTMSGRVIPQRNSNEVIHFNQQNSQNSQNPQNPQQMQPRTLAQSRSNSASMTSMSTKTSSYSNFNSINTTTAASSTGGAGVAGGAGAGAGANASGSLAQRSASTSSRASDGSYPHSTILTTSRKVPLVYPALLSKVADTFRSRIVLGDRIKNELTYKNAFTGSEAVDLITYIIKTPDRNLALLLGRALDAQKFFHDVTYDHRLRDTSNEVYQFNEIVVEGEDGPVMTDEQKSTTSVPVNGVFTLLAECYSPTCTRDQLCYSIACPRRLEQQARLNMKPQPGLKRAESRLSLHGDDEKEQKLWIHTVSKEIADSTPDREKKRQEVICEVIYTERDFVKDLEYLRDFWIKPLRNSNIIPETRREKFIRDVFSRIMEVHSVNIKLAEALTKRQQQAPVVKQLGDIFLEYVPKFEPFIRYGAHQLTGKYEFEREKSMNPTFAKFVDETERMKESRKLELNGYLTKPTTRLARYPLLLEAVLKNTDEEDLDKTEIPEAIELIRGFLTRVNVETGKSENRFNLFQLNQQLIWRSQHDYVDMRLTEENRQIIFKGFLKKRTQDKENQGDVQVYLFDHCLLFVRIKMANKREQLKVHRKPIPLELLQIAESEEMPTKSLAKRPATLTAKIPTVSRSNDASGNRFPLTFQYLGRKGYEITLFATTFITRKKWVEHIEQQKEVLAEKGDVFNTHVLKDRFFHGNNKVNCLVPLDGGRKLLYGTDNGIWLAEVKFTPEGPSTSDPVKIITLSNITQIDALEEYGMLLALSDKSLHSWPLDCLETPDPVANSRRSKKVMGHINFYKVGICLGRVLVCTVKSSSLTTTVRVMEPNEPQPRRQQKFSKLLKSQSEGLKVYKEFYIPSEALSISFLKRKLCVGCAKGFEIVDLKTLETQSLLDPADTSLDFVIRRDVLKPIAIYPLGRNFLLNYSDVSFFVNANGWRSRQDWKIEWEGVPQHFAFSYPYLIAFEPNFIEIRHVDTSELVRVVTGENIRFLHESTREIIYAHEDVNGYDEVLSLDFWENNNSNGNRASSIQQTSATPLASVNEESNEP